MTGAPARGRLVRSLGLLDLVLIGLNGVIGAGIFLLPGQVASALGPWAWTAYVACAAICLLIALCFAEMASMHQETGGAYLYAREAFGPFAGFLVGWVVWLAAVLGWASVASGFATLLGDNPALAGTPWHAMLTGPWGKATVLLAMVGGLATLNLLGVKVGALANHFFSVAKLLPLLLFVTWGASRYAFQPDMAPTAPASPLHFPLQALPAAILQVLFTFSGFEEIPVPAGEVRDAQHVIPRALLLVIGLTAVLYLGIQLVAQAACPDLGQAPDPLARAAGMFMGPHGQHLLALGGLVSLLGVNAAVAFTGPRSMYALAVDRFLPRGLALVHPRWRTPWAAIAATAALVVALPLMEILADAWRSQAAPGATPWLPRFDLQTLVKLSALASVLQYMPTCLAVLVMRARQPERKVSFRVPGGPTVPLLALAVCIWLIWSSDPADQLWTLGGMALGIPAYLLSRVRVDRRDDPGARAT